MKWPKEIEFIPNSRKPVGATNARMDGKVCVVTGATSGVGYQAAMQLAAAGASLVVVVRNKQKANQLKNTLVENYNTSVEIVLADFGNLDDVRAAAETILGSGKPIDVLINNVGIHRTMRTETPLGYEAAFCVNHLSQFLFTRLLLGRMAETPGARILYVNSQGHRFGGLKLDDLHWEKRRYNGYLGYGASKVAQLLTVWELADLMAEHGVTVNAIHPGEVRTNIGMDNGVLFKHFQKIFVWPLLSKPEVAGKAIYYLAAANEMSAVTGKFFNKTTEETPAGHATDRALGKRVWQISEQLTGLEPLRRMGEDEQQEAKAVALSGAKVG